MGTVLAALLGACGAIAVGVIANFVAEDYRRHRDGSAVAAALAGELASYRDGWKIHESMLQLWLQATKNNERDKLALRPVDRPTDPIFEEMVAKLGLLGPDLVEQIALVYGQIRGYRVGLEILSKQHRDMNDHEFDSRSNGALSLLRMAVNNGEPLINNLRQRAHAMWKFRPFEPVHPVLHTTPSK